MKNSTINCYEKGFTLLELLVVVVLIGGLSAIALSGWSAFINRQRLNNANYQVYQVMRQAQSKAQKENITWQASFREQNEVLQWAVHPASLNPSLANWNELHETIQLDSETTLQKSNGVRRIKFDHQGNVAHPPLGRVTLSLKGGSTVKRCVFVSTILGALRTAKQKSTAKNGKYCY
ncbi:MAG: Tfp pilus assembly protein FimT/FimU [Prochloraceae cyanobacterium]